MTPEQRRRARENFKSTSQLTAEQRQKLKQKWEEYLSLPVEEKEKLKQLAAGKSLSRPAQPLVPISTVPPAKSKLPPLNLSPLSPLPKPVGKPDRKQ